MGRRRPPTPERPAPIPLATLAELLARQGVAGSAPRPASPAAGPASPAANSDVPDLAGSARITLRRERKGHGGKTVTVVAGLCLDAQRLDSLARAIRRALGVGATVTDDAIVVQGDLVPRVQTFLIAHGARIAPRDFVSGRAGERE
jgi:translation initiation factor 1 (eIF-1/SUI1)